MTKSTANSESQNLHPGLVNGENNIEDPHADILLDEDELAEIYSRPTMNPEHCVAGAHPESNKILDDELTLLESKREKCLELIKQSTEIHDILDKTKSD
jgi:hypothetical protein